MRSTDDLMIRIRGEYREMPGLCLSVAQAARLWQLDVEVCQHILDGLVTDNFLGRTTTGLFVARPTQEAVGKERKDTREEDRRDAETRRLRKRRA